MRDREVPEFPELPDRWQAIAANMVYRSTEDRLVSFSQTQVELGINTVTTTLKAHPIWQNLTQALSQIDPLQVANQHLQDCQAEIHGYWDETDQLYEMLRFKQFPIPQLISSSLGVTPNQAANTHWLQLRYALTIPPSTIVGELLLILDDSLTVIDENWLIDVHSPHVVAVVG